MNKIEVKTEGCDYVKKILAAITDSLESEERRLKPRSVQERWPWTVRGYPNEDWIRYLLVKKLADRFPELEFALEAKSGGVPRSDLLICGHASVELKGPLLIRDNFDKKHLQQHSNRLSEAAPPSDTGTGTRTLRTLDSPRAQF